MTTVNDLLKESESSKKQKKEEEKKNHKKKKSQDEKNRSTTQTPTTSKVKTIEQLRAERYMIILSFIKHFNFNYRIIF